MYAEPLLPGVSILPAAQRQLTEKLKSLMQTGGDGYMDEYVEQW